MYHFIAIVSLIGNLILLALMIRGLVRFLGVPQNREILIEVWNENKIVFLGCAGIAICALIGLLQNA